MQLYFQELKRRDGLREEYVKIAEAIDMLVDLHRVGMHFEASERWTKKELEANQIKHNIIERTKLHMMSVKTKIGAGLM